MSNIIRIGQYTFAEDEIRDHACTIKGCRNLTYSVCTSNFDDIWRRTRSSAMGIQRCPPDAPRLVLDFGRHHVHVVVDDAVPVGEAKCLTADDATTCEAAPTPDGLAMFTLYDAAGRRSEHPRPRCDCGGVLDSHPTVDVAVCRTCAKEIPGEERARACRRIVEQEIEAAQIGAVDPELVPDLARYVREWPADDAAKRFAEGLAGEGSARRAILEEVQKLTVAAVARDQEPGAAPAQSPPIESVAGLARAREVLRATTNVGQSTTEEPTHDMLRERRLRPDPDRNKASEPPMPPAPPSGTTELRDHRARTIDALLTAIDRELAGAARPIDCVGTLAHAVAVLAGAPL